MDVGDVLLERPWTYDKNEIQFIGEIIHMHLLEMAKLLHYPMKPESLKRRLRSIIKKEWLQVRHVFIRNTNRN